jgi:hypothetical protein
MRFENPHTGYLYGYFRVNTSERLSPGGAFSGLLASVPRFLKKGNMKLRHGIGNFALVLLFAGTVFTQQPAAATDTTAKWMVDMERRWAESGCTGEQITATILADDFIGTAPSGNRYTKQDTLKKSDHKETDCKLLEAKVYYYGDSIAIVQGSESAVGPAAEGSKPRHLIWNDTWMKRNGKWQIISVQDMVAPEKK